jgi:flagellar biosynthesis protein FlhF
MKVKRYIVDELPEAVQMIRSELGSDAVILNTKEIRTGGFLGMFSKKRVEVIAAVDEASKKPPARRPVPARIPEPPMEADEAPVPSPMLPSSAVRERYGGKPAGNQTADKISVRESQHSYDVQSAKDTQAATLAAAVQTLEARENKQMKDETSALLEELRSMKEMMAKMAKQQTFRSMPESVMKWSRRLAEQGVDAAYVEQFAEAVNQQLGEAYNGDEAASYEAARSVLRSWLQDSRGNGFEPTTRIVHFVGPTGVGKTTTIAKLAAEQSITYQRSVGLITADTYRIAAVDQLRTYADILGIPLEVVFSPSELTRSYKKLSDRDLLFMDTAGRNYRNELFVSEVNSLLAPGEQTETVLVLSMTHKYSDMKLIANQFVKYGVNQLLLTKFDETDSFGSVVNLVREYSFQISYITIGQTVPDDIKRYEPDDLIRRLLGDPAHE